MAKKKDCAFFICPRWNELAPGEARIDAKTLAAIKAGRWRARPYAAR